MNTYLKTDSKKTVLLLLLIMVFAFSALPWYAVDFREYFAPAALARDPYSVPGFYNPPWTAWLMFPFAILPPNLGQACLIIVSLVVLTLVCRKQGLSTITTFLFLTSYPVIYSLLYGNLEWLVFLGLLLPRPAGMLFLMVKPQVGLGIAIAWIVEAWKKDRGSVSLLIAPAVIITLFSLALYGWWLPDMLKAAWVPDAEIWPWGLLLVPWLLKDSKRYQFLIGPFVAPHLIRGSWAGLFLFLADHPWVMAATSLVSWVIGLLL